MDTYADDLARHSGKTGLKNANPCGPLHWRGEVAVTSGRHGQNVLPWPSSSARCTAEQNPLCAPISVFDGLRAELRKIERQFYKEITLPFYEHRPCAKIRKASGSTGGCRAMLGDMEAHYDCIKAFSERTYGGPQKFDVPTLILHGDDDQIVPISAAASDVFEDRLRTPH